MMKYVVLIMDGASGYPVPLQGNKTSLELAHKPYLDALARRGVMGLSCNVPQGMEPSSASTKRRGRTSCASFRTIRPSTPVAKP